MKIAIFSDTFYPQVNGVAGVAHQSAHALTALGHEVMIVAPTFSKKKFPHAHTSTLHIVRLPSLPAFVYPGERTAFPFGIGAFFALKKFKPDIIHTHTPFVVGWAAVLYAKLFGATLVGTHHTFFDSYLEHVHLDYDWMRLFSWKYTVGYYNWCTMVTSPTEALATELLAHGLRVPVIQLSNSVDTAVFIPRTTEERAHYKKQYGISDKALVYMGRVSYEKNIAQVINAFALVVSRDPSYTLMIIGDGPQKKELQQLAKSLDVADQVVFTGFLHGAALAEALGAADCFITASKSENMPLSILEGMAVGLPVIGINEKGIGEIVINNKNGFLLASDDTAVVAHAIEDMFADTAKMHAMGFASRAHAEQYAHMRIAEELAILYTRHAKS